jgi:hypothetical protein
MSYALEVAAFTGLIYQMIPGIEFRKSKAE